MFTNFREHGLFLENFDTYDLLVQPLFPSTNHAITIDPLSI